MEKPSVHTTSEKILQQAAVLFSERGYDALTLRDIAQACDIKAPSLYNHFKDKQTLYRAVLKFVFSHKSPEIINILKSDELAETQLRQFIQSACRSMAEDSTFRNLFQRELLGTNPEYLQYLSQEVMAETCQALQGILEKLAPHCDAHFMTTSLVGLIFFQFQMNLMRPFMPSAEEKHSDPTYIAAQIERFVFNQLNPINA